MQWFRLSNLYAVNDEEVAIFVDRYISGKKIAVMENRLVRFRTVPITIKDLRSLIQKFPGSTGLDVFHIFIDNSASISIQSINYRDL
jgi:hypothetical protein